MESGKLLIVATPIGNLGDITLRAIETLKEADVIAAEDTRHTVKLLNHYEIKNKLLSFHEYSKPERLEELLEMLREGKHVALVSDAGTPVISDPGFALVKKCAQEGIPVESLPGACAMVTAVTLCGMDCSHFVFWGFLSQKQAARKKELEEMTRLGLPCVVYESPNRVEKTLKDICEICGADTPVCACRELTKLHEEILRGSALEVMKELAGRQSVKGEFAIVLYPEAMEKEPEDEQIKSALAKCMEDGMTRKSAAGFVAEKFGIPKNKAYQMALELGT